jgi:hypothetical protein
MTLSSETDELRLGRTGSFGYVPRGNAHVIGAGAGIAISIHFRKDLEACLDPQYSRKPRLAVPGRG